MLKKVLSILVILVYTNSFAQNSIKGKMIPAEKYSWAILYKLNGVKQNYVANTTVENGVFAITIPKGSEPGMYRILYDNNNNKFVDIIYNNEDIDLEFHPEYPLQLVKFNKSEENKLYQDYIENVASTQNHLDSIQVVYFQEKDLKKGKKLNKLYTTNLKKLVTIQNTFEKKSQGKVAANFIKASKRFYANNLIKDTNEYLKLIKTHYFDYVDFDNKLLAKSSLLIDRVMDFVMYLNTSDDSNKLMELRKNAMETSLSKIENVKLKKDVIESLAYTFAQQENIPLVNYIFKNHFNKLPVALQDFEFKNVVLDMVKTTIGQKAPEILWEEKGKTKSLHKLKDSKYYLVVFWSSTCPHCLKELPVLQKFLEDKKEFKTIAIGLETEESRLAWKEETFYYETFTHILGKGKYKNSYVKDYGVSSTPNFFLMDESKTIIAKPYDVKALKEFYAKNIQTKKK